MEEDFAPRREYMVTKGVLDRQVSQTNSIFMIADKCERYWRDMEKQFQDLKESFNNKADLISIINLEAELKNYTTIEQHNSLKESLKKYGEVADISNVREALKTIKENMEKKAFKEDVNNIVSKAKQDIEKNIKDLCSKLFGVEEKVSNHEAEITSSRRKLMEIDKNIKDCRNLCENMSKAVSKSVNTRTYKYDMDALNSKFKECIQYDHLQKHLDYINPLVGDCLGKINDFKREIYKAKEMIARFDEVMLDKASKFSVDNLWQELKEYISKEELDSIQDEYKHEKRRMEHKMSVLSEEFK